MRTMLTLSPLAPTIDVILAEDHHLVRSGLKVLLEKQNFNVMAEAENAEELLAYLARGTHAEIIVLDPSLCNTDSVNLINTLKRSYPATRILVFSIIDREEYVIDMMDNGASAYLLKSISTDEMMFAIVHVKAGGQYLCSELSLKFLENTAAMVKDRKAQLSKVALSKRELEVLVLIADGFTNQEIAGKLSSSRRTIEGHRKSVIEKLGAHNTATLIRYAVKHGLIA